MIFVESSSSSPAELICDIFVGIEQLTYNYSGLKLTSFPHNHRTIHEIEMDSPLRGSLQKYVEIISSCINHKWPVLLVGSPNSGKRRSIYHLARLTGNDSNLIEYSVTPSTDLTELLGSFEQANVGRKLLHAMKLLDYFCGKLLFVSMTLFSSSNLLQDFSDYQQHISQILSIYSPLSIKIQEIIEKNELILHCGNANSNDDNIFNELNSLLLLLQKTINILFN